MYEWCFLYDQGYIIVKIYYIPIYFPLSFLFGFKTKFLLRFDSKHLFASKRSASNMFLDQADGQICCSNCLLQSMVIYVSKINIFYFFFFYINSYCETSPGALLKYFGGPESAQCQSTSGSTVGNASGQGKTGTTLYISFLSIRITLEGKWI